MKILVIIHNQEGSGVFDKVKELCVAYANLGHSVTLVCTSAKNRFKGEWKTMGSVSVFEAPDLLYGRLRQGVDLWNTAQRMRAASGKHFDIIHSIDCRPNVIIPSLYFKAIWKIPLVLSWWDLYGSEGTALERSGRLYNVSFGRFESFLETKFRKYADHATVVSSFLLEKLIQLGYPKDKITLSRIGCQIENPYIASRYSARKALGIEVSARILICTGVLFRQDLCLLLRSLQILKEERDRVMPRTILIGDHDVPSSTCTALNILLKERISTRNEFLQYLAAADFGLLPMRCNTANKARWPSKGSDYWNMGLSVIATPINDFETLFPQFDLGFLSQSDSPEMFAQSIRSALDRTVAMNDITPTGIERFVQTELSWDSIAMKLTSVFQSLIVGE